MKQKLNETSKTFLALFLALAVAFGAFGVYWVLYDRELTFSQIVPFSEEEVIGCVIHLRHEDKTPEAAFLKPEEPEYQRLMELLEGQTYKKTGAYLSNCYADLTFGTEELGPGIQINLSRQALSITADSKTTRYTFLSGGDEVYTYLMEELPAVCGVPSGENGWSWTWEYPDPS